MLYSSRIDEDLAEILEPYVQKVELVHGEDELDEGEVFFSKVEKKYKRKRQRKTRPHSTQILSATIPPVSVPVPVLPIPPIKKRKKVSFEKTSVNKNEQVVKEIELPQTIGTMKVAKKSKLVNGRDKLSSMMQDSSALFEKGDFTTLYQRFIDQGYLLVRGLIKKEITEQACIQTMARTSKEDLEAFGGYTVELAQGRIIRGKEEFVRLDSTKDEKKKWASLIENSSTPLSQVTHCIESLLSALARGRELSESSYLTSAIILNPLFTWLRIKNPGEGTVEHADLYHFLYEAPQLFERSTIDKKDNIEEEKIRFESEEKHSNSRRQPQQQNANHLSDKPNAPILGTVWVALQDIRLAEEGGIAILAKSHASLDYSKGPLPQSSLPKSFFLKSRPHLEWLACDYKAGDVILFHMRTIHATPKNTSNQPRISLDTRFLLEPRGKDISPHHAYTSFLQDHSHIIRRIS